MIVFREWTVVVGLALALSIPSSLRAQIPGYQGPTSGSLGADYYAVVLEGVQGVLTEWSDAFTSDALDRLVDLYVEEALIILPGQDIVRGRDRVAQVLASAMQSHAAGNVFVQDFDASGSMAMVHATYVIEAGVGGEAGPASSGLLTMVLIQRGGREWKIRSQTFIER